MTTIQFLYMTGILWWILAGAVLAGRATVKDMGSLDALAKIIVFFVFVGVVHFGLALFLVDSSMLDRLLN